MSGTIAEQRLVSADLLAEPVRPDGGTSALATASSVLAPTTASEVGLWDAGPGADADVEVDELFLVLTGRGTVTFADGSSLDLRPGVLARLVAGDRTTWTVSERLRKLYLA